MDLSLSGKRAVVTGGSRGIGFAIADALAAEGTEIALLARDPDRLEAAAVRLRERGGRVLALSADTVPGQRTRQWPRWDLPSGRVSYALRRPAVQEPRLCRRMSP
jgi:NAD(P)-dependent dehydrogenase (short-subunit alcohol dehydrogenase family)